MSSLRVVAISEMKRRGFSRKNSQEIPRQNYLFSTEQIKLYNYTAKPSAVTVASLCTAYSIHIIYTKNAQLGRTNIRSFEDERTLNMNEKKRGFSFVRERMKDRNEVSKNCSWRNQTWTTHERIRSWTMNDRSSVPKWCSRMDSEKILSSFVHVSFMFRSWFVQLPFSFSSSLSWVVS